MEFKSGAKCFCSTSDGISIRGTMECQSLVGKEMLVGVSVYDVYPKEKRKTFIDTLMLIPPSHLEPVNEEVFHIGDKVASAIGTAILNVIGFEPQTNRVLCSTDKQPLNTRIRYAYKLNELNAYVAYVVLQPGKIYKVNGQYETLVVRHPENSNMFLLIDLHDGVIIGSIKHCKYNVLKSDLIVRGISAMDEVVKC